MLERMQQREKEVAGRNLTLVLCSMNADCCQSGQLEAIVLPLIGISASTTQAGSQWHVCHLKLECTVCRAWQAQTSRASLIPDVISCKQFGHADAMRSGQMMRGVHACARAPAINDKHILWPLTPKERCGQCSQNLFNITAHVRRSILPDLDPHLIAKCAEIPRVKLSEGLSPSLRPSAVAMLNHTTPDLAFLNPSTRQLQRKGSKHERGPFTCFSDDIPVERSCLCRSSHGHLGHFALPPLRKRPPVSQPKTLHAKLAQR